MMNFMASFTLNPILYEIHILNIISCTQHIAVNKSDYVTDNAMTGIIWIWYDTGAPQKKLDQPLTLHPVSYFA